MEFTIFSTKIGVENLLLLTVGLLHFGIVWLRRRELTLYHRLWLHVWEGLFFVLYGLLYDLFRYRVVLDFLLGTVKMRNLLGWRMTILFLSLIPVYATLVQDVLQLLIKRKTQSIPPAATPKAG